MYYYKRPINCAVCGKDLSLHPEDAVVNRIVNAKTEEIEFLKVCCRGKCDQSFRNSVSSNKMLEEYDNLKDYLIPDLFMSNIFYIIKKYQSGIKIFKNDDVFEDFIKLIGSSFGYISREQTPEETEHAKHMMNIC